MTGDIIRFGDGGAPYGEASDGIHRRDIGRRWGHFIDDVMRTAMKGETVTIEADELLRLLGATAEVQVEGLEQVSEHAGDTLENLRMILERMEPKKHLAQKDLTAIREQVEAIEKIFDEVDGTLRALIDDIEPPR